MSTVAKGSCAVPRRSRPGLARTTAATLCINVLSLSAQPPDEGCSQCHTCAPPAPGTPCLRSCTRAKTMTQIPIGSPPDVVLLNQLEERYLPVPFDHKGHARMAEMTRGCAVCHHYTPEGTTHPACKTCHEITSARTEIQKPGLKGAYHRQCLNCHREWSDDTKCETCHQAKTGAGRRKPVQISPTPDDLVGRMHPPIPEPDTEIFQARQGTQAGTKVIFYHKEHIHRFGLGCVECHHEDNCNRCHNSAVTRRAEPTLTEHHQPCAACHVTTEPDRCGGCHWKEGTPKPPRFDHDRTAFALKNYHDQTACRDCHTTVPFTKPERDCSACHKAFDPATFRHEVTGQSLDAVHAGQECGSCHLEGRFDRTPNCTECHESSTGIAYPARTPGPKLQPPSNR